MTPAGLAEMRASFEAVQRDPNTYKGSPITGDEVAERVVELRHQLAWTATFCNNARVHDMADKQRDEVVNAVAVVRTVIVSQLAALERRRDPFAELEEIVNGTKGDTDA